MGHDNRGGNQRNRSGRGNNQHKGTEINLNTFEGRWIQDTFDDKTISFAETFGKYLVENRLTTSQIRNVFGEVKRIESNVGDEFNKSTYKDFLLLRPKIAYAAKRSGSRGILDFQKVMDKAHNAVTGVQLTDNDGKKSIEQKRADAFKNFKDFFEAVLAYHKAFGGRD